MDQRTKQRSESLRQAIRLIEEATVELLAVSDSYDDFFSKQHDKLEAVLIELTGGMYQAMPKKTKRQQIERKKVAKK